MNSNLEQRYPSHYDIVKRCEFCLSYDFREELNHKKKSKDGTGNTKTEKSLVPYFMVFDEFAPLSVTLIEDTEYVYSDLKQLTTYFKSLKNQTDEDIRLLSNIYELLDLLEQLVILAENSQWSAYSALKEQALPYNHKSYAEAMANTWELNDEWELGNRSEQLQLVKEFKALLLAKKKKKGYSADHLRKDIKLAKEFDYVKTVKGYKENSNPKQVHNDIKANLLLNSYEIKDDLSNEPNQKIRSRRYLIRKIYSDGTKSMVFKRSDGTLVDFLKDTEIQ